MTRSRVTAGYTRRAMIQMLAAAGMQTFRVGRMRCGLLAQRLDDALVRQPAKWAG